MRPNVTWRPMRERELQKLHLHLDTTCLNPELFILLFVQENTKLSDFWLTEILSQVTHYAHWQSMSDHLQVSVTILQQILYNVLSHFNCWELYFIYTYISASFIPWNIFKSAWLLYSITIHIYHKTIIPVCQQEILYNKHCFASHTCKTTFMKLPYRQFTHKTIFLYDGGVQ